MERIIRWTARIWAAASLLFLSAFIFGNAGGGGRWPTIDEFIGLALFPTGIIAGLLIALRKELWGGGITAVSLAGFYAWHFVMSGHLPRGPWFALVAAPGFLFLLGGLLARPNRPVPAATGTRG